MSGITCTWPRLGPVRRPVGWRAARQNCYDIRTVMLRRNQLSLSMTIVRTITGSMDRPGRTVVRYASNVAVSHSPADVAIFAADGAREMRPSGVVQRPPRLLLTLLGDYWWQRTEALPSAAIVALLAELGVSVSEARAALSRLTGNGVLVTSKSGRRTYSRLSSRAAAILDDGARRIFSFGAVNQPWDGMWSLVAFSIPEDNRAARDALRKQLRWLGFAPLYDALWVSPRNHAAEVIGSLQDIGIGTATAFRATSVPAVSPVSSVSSVSSGDSAAPVADIP